MARAGLAGSPLPAPVALAADRSAAWEKAGYLTRFSMEGAWLFDLG